SGIRRAHRALPAGPGRRGALVSDPALAGEEPPAQTESGLPIAAYYESGEGQALPAPGEFPFTRGLTRDGYRTRLWTLRQYAGFGSAAQTNERFHYLLNAGQTGLSVAFDLPTQMGYDSDDEMARGEVG